jgi:hypothetical protein
VEDLVGHAFDAGEKPEDLVFGAVFEVAGKQLGRRKMVVDVAQAALPVPPVEDEEAGIAGFDAGAGEVAGVVLDVWLKLPDLRGSHGDGQLDDPALETAATFGFPPHQPGDGVPPATA